MVRRSTAKPEIGDQIDMWFPGGTVLAVEPYTGKYDFTWNVRVTANRTGRGWFDICV
jgi:hypothetical protein